MFLVGEDAQIFAELQQHLPFTVLKLIYSLIYISVIIYVATALTVYGIETSSVIVSSVTG